MRVSRRRLGPGPVRGPAASFRRRPLWALVRLALWLFGAAVLFGLLMLASLWFAIPFASALVGLGAVSFEIVRRARIGWLVVRRWRLR